MRKNSFTNRIETYIHQTQYINNRRLSPRSPVFHIIQLMNMNIICLIFKTLIRMKLAWYCYVSCESETYGKN